MAAGESCQGVLGMEEIVTSPMVQSMRGLTSRSQGSPKIRFSWPQLTTRNTFFLLSFSNPEVEGYFVADYSSLISTSIHVLCFKQLGESLCSWYPFFLAKSWSMKSPVAPLSTRVKVLMICAPLFAKMEIEMWIDFSSESDMNIGAIVSGGKDVDTFLQSKNPWLPWPWWWPLFPPFLHLLWQSR